LLREALLDSAVAVDVVEDDVANVADVVDAGVVASVDVVASLWVVGLTVDLGGMRPVVMRWSVRAPADAQASHRSTDA
jgi:hypothetical protein